MSTPSSSSGGASVGASSLDPRREFRRQVDSNIGKCVESMAQLIKTAKMGTTREDVYLEANRVSALTATILQSSEQLLTQVEQLKRLHVLQDFDALNAELDEDTRHLEARREELGKEIEKWTGIVKKAADVQLAQVVDGSKEREGSN